MTIVEKIKYNAVFHMKSQCELRWGNERDRYASTGILQRLLLGATDTEVKEWPSTLTYHKKDGVSIK